MRAPAQRVRDGEHLPKAPSLCRVQQAGALPRHSRVQRLRGPCQFAHSPRCEHTPVQIRRWVGAGLAKNGRRQPAGRTPLARCAVHHARELPVAAVVAAASARMPLRQCHVCSTLGSCHGVGQTCQKERLLPGRDTQQAEGPCMHALGEHVEGRRDAG